MADVERAHRHLSCVPGDVALWPQLTGAETLTLLGNLSGAVDEARSHDDLAVVAGPPDSFAPVPALVLVGGDSGGARDRAVRPPRRPARMTD